MIDELYVDIHLDLYRGSGIYIRSIYIEMLYSFFIEGYSICRIEAFDYSIVYLDNNIFELLKEVVIHQIVFYIDIAVDFFFFVIKGRFHLEIKINEVSK